MADRDCYVHANMHAWSLVCTTACRPEPASPCLAFKASVSAWTSMEVVPSDTHAKAKHHSNHREFLAVEAVIALYG